MAKKNTFFKILALILALGMMMGCLAACSDEGGNNQQNNNNNNNNGKDPLRDGLKSYTFDGLTFYLSEDFQKSELSTADAQTFIGNNSAIATIFGEAAPSGVTTSLEYARHYSNSLDGQGHSITISVENDVYYAVTDFGDGFSEVRGFYVHNGYCWAIYLTVPSSTVPQEYVTYVTLGQIDENHSHSGSSAGNNNNGTTGTTENPNNSGNKETVTVYALVPNSWGTPGCWAWKDGGDNVFSAWPGQSMTKSGTYYTVEINSWADYVIINGNSGSTQTEDIAIEPGCDIWLVIHPDAVYYTLFYQAPTDAELAEIGY